LIVGLLGVVASSGIGQILSMILIGTVLLVGGALMEKITIPIASGTRSQRWRIC